ncbi:IS110 family transposase [Deinococcus sp.]|uniref:IS110 family transposase n=1 Tax=Deinococcus sp. TaxID=47478 RepID=UPI003B5A2881
MLGIDVSKASLAVCLLKQSTAQELTGEFPNTPAGHLQLQRWLAQHDGAQTPACMESTGPYHRSLALFLFQGGHPVSIVNPRRIKAYSVSRLSRAKTDGVDARLIAQFGLREDLPIWTPPTAARVKLRDLQRRLDEIGRTRCQHQQRCEHCQDADILASLAREASFWSEEEQRLHRQLESVLGDSAELGEDVALLTSIPGIGALTARRLVASVDIKRFENAASFAAYLGVTPREHSSGTSVHKQPRMSKIGSKTLRTALYFPAMQATRCNTQIRAQYQRLVAAGKPKKSAIGAAMRKLAQQIYGVWSSRLPYDPTLGLAA